MAESEQPTDPGSQPDSGEGAPGQSADIHRIQFEQLKHIAPEEPQKNVNRFDDVTLHVSIELGRVAVPVREILGWREGNVVETEKLSGQPMEIMVNGRQFGKGEVVVVGDNLAIRITDLHTPELE